MDSYKIGLQNAERDILKLIVCPVHLVALLQAGKKDKNT